MGHLINSNSMRLGWFSNWFDSWYADHVYYTELLYIVFRIRLFLTFFFSRRIFEQAGYFYSHFEVINKYNIFYINVFFYDGSVENLLDSLVYDQHNDSKKRNYSHSKPNLRKLSEPWKYLIVLNWAHRFFLYSWPKAKLNYFIKALNLLNQNKLAKFFTHSFFLKNCRGSSSRAVFFYVLLISVKFSISDNFVKSSVNYNYILSRFIYSIAWSNWNFGLFSHFKQFLSFIVSFLALTEHLSISFFSMNSYSVNSKFLARFVARKLKQNYTVMELLDPIKKELNHISALTRYPLSDYFHSIRRDDYQRVNVLEYRNGLFKYSFLFYLGLVVKLFINFIL